VFENKHQLLEYMAILELDHKEHDTSLEKLKVRLTAKEATKKYVGAFEDDVKNIVGMIPGAAYGPAKMWPARHYIDVGKKLIDEKGCRVIVMGVEKESDICLRISEELGQAAICLAGETTLAESAALLSDCKVVICNDSGGMHLAAAAGTPVVAVFGMTDPTKTGPLGEGHKLILADDVKRSRDLDKGSPEAIEALSSIKPERVYDAAAELLK
jgi:heptosyltransferase-2